MARAQTSLVFTFFHELFLHRRFLSGLLLRVRSYRFVLRAAALCLLAGFFPPPACKACGVSICLTAFVRAGRRLRV